MKKFIVFALLLLPCLAQADESTIKLKDGPNRELVEAQCGICHSNDMILINSPFLDQKGWDAEVHKMIKVMGAPLPAEDVTKVVEYLTKYYGK
jgi:sulfite dehydrogenase (cytochrome) subunit B